MFSFLRKVKGFFAGGKGNGEFFLGGMELWEERKDEGVKMHNIEGPTEQCGP